ncbi:hypothetical protein IX38_00530 [Chryseobacterium luteum]|uniref:Uncharacterized protein n=1 Tax=Chryseobacterium luteum TaxID=421531 RepID=A0A085ZX73_9FLAO|nr:hypothetical protein IX38_00530 [Chryseobacterium luteum]
MDTKFHNQVVRVVSPLEKERLSNILFNYSKGSGFVYFLDKKNNKITIVSFSGVSGKKEYDTIKSLSNNNKNEFEEIIFATATSMEILK